MNPYRCQICNEVYLGMKPADRCPFCGADGKHLLHAAEWLDYGAIELCDQSMEDCKYALEIEVSNQAFYACCKDHAQDNVTQAIFKRLSKQEGEHAELIADMAGLDEPDLPKVECADNDDEENFKQAHAREKRAIKFYTDVAKRAPELRMKEVFRALAEIESNHLVLSNTYK